MEKYKSWSSMDILLATFIFLSVLFPHFLFLALIPLIWSVAKDWKLPKLKVRGLPQYLWILFYMILIIYFFFTPDRVGGGVELEHKLSFLIFPILMLTAKTKFDLGKLILVLCGSLFFAGLVGLFNAFGCWTDGGVGCFYTVHISPIHHPSYLMAYVVFSLVGAWIGYFKAWIGFKLKWIIPYTLLMMIYHLYSQSLAGLLFLMVIIGAVVALWFWKRFGKLVFGISIVAVFGLLYSAVKTIPQIEWQWNSGVSMLSQFINDPEDFVQTREFPMTGNEERLTVWAASTVIIKENPLGVGLGASDEALKDKLMGFSQTKQAEKGLNAHNQYFQFGLEMGWVGILLFLGICTYLIYYSLKTRNWLLFVLIACLLFNCLFESILQRQSGMVFFIFWASVLSTLNPKKELV